MTSQWDMDTWFATVTEDIWGAPLRFRYLGPRLADPAQSTGVCLPVMTPDARGMLSIDFGLALALVDVSMKDVVGPGRRVRPLREIESALLRAQCIELAGVVAGQFPALYVRVSDHSCTDWVVEGAGQIAHCFEVSCLDIVGDCQVMGPSAQMPGPAVVVAPGLKVGPGDLVFADGVVPAPEHAAWILGEERWLGRWVETTEGVAVEVLGRPEA